MGRPRRWVGVAAGLLVAASGTFALPARPAAAHATLQDTNPRAGAVLEAPPAEIVLDFDEPVESRLGGVTLLDQDGGEIALDAPARTGDDTQVVVPVADPDTMGPGVYVVIYRVTSADSHPVAGSFTFQVGSGEADQQQVLDRLTSGRSGGERIVGWGLGVVKFLAFVGMVLLLGAWATALLMPGEVPGRVRLARLAGAGCVALVVGTAGAFALQGPRAAGTGLGDALDTGLWADVAATTYGRALLVRLVLAALAVLPVLGVRYRPTSAWTASAATVGVGILVTFGVAGHAGSGRDSGLGIALDVVHLAAVAAWSGGLAALVWGRRDWLADGEPSATIARRFSLVATVAVPVVVATGAGQAWRILRDAGALSDTTYGRTLVAKVALVTLLVALGGTARSVLRRSGAVTIRRLVAAEAAIALAVLGVTAGLVNVAPVREAVVVPVVVTVRQGDIAATVTVTPARLGANDVHVTVTLPADAVEPTLGATLRISLPDLGVEPQSIPLTAEGPDHYSAYGVEFIFPGAWQVDLLVERSATETVLLQATVDI